MPRAFSVNMVIPHELKLMKLMIDDDDFDARSSIALITIGNIVNQPEFKDCNNHLHACVRSIYINSANYIWPYGTAKLSN